MNNKTPISALQELMAVRNHPLPKYQEDGSGTSFRCTVYVDGITAVGFATSKKAAKHESAKKALEKLQFTVEHMALAKEPAVVERPLKNFVGELNEYSSKNGLKYPNYEFVTCLVNGHFIFKCGFLGAETQGRGSTKKDAKQDAAKNMLKLIDPSKPATSCSKYKIVQETRVFETDDCDKIISMFNRLSTERRHLVAPSACSIESASEIEFDGGDSIDSLEAQIKEYDLKYFITDLQTNPYVVCLRIKGTHFTFIAADEEREEALRKVYKNLLEVKKTGCSLDSSLTRFI